MVLIDIDVGCNVIPKRELEALKLDEKKLPKACYKLLLFCQKDKPQSQKIIKCQYKDKEYDLDFQVIKQGAIAVVSSVELGVVKRMYGVEEKTESYCEDEGNMRMYSQDWAVFMEFIVYFCKQKFHQ